MSASPPLVTGTADLTPAWCTAALASHTSGATVVAVEARPIGTGQVADTVRLRLTWDPPDAGPATVVVKVPAADDSSRMAARLTRTYEVEAGFYRDLAASLPVRAPHCYFVDHDLDTDAYVVVLEDVAPAEQGDQMAGCSPDQAAAAIDEMAALHAPRWGDPSLASFGWLHRSDANAADALAATLVGFVPMFLERYGTVLDPEVSALVERVTPRFSAYLHDRPEPWTVAHGDFRVDNLLFGGPRVVVVDWQTVAHGPGVADLAYFLGASLPTDARRRHEQELVEHYRRRLDERGVALGGDELWTGYRRTAFSGLVMAVLASILVARTDRGDEMFVTMADRHSRHALDLDAESLLP